MSKVNYADLDHIVEAVRNAKEDGKQCALLIGAGCSVSAGIPLAMEFMDIIRKRWPNTIKGKRRTYAAYMNALPPGERRKLIHKYIDKAKINWAHIALAQLMKQGYVDRVLTVNFDPLVMRACALVNLFPGIYDFAASQNFNPAHVSERAIFHLHGQHTGFVLLNTKKEVNRIAKAVKPLIDDCSRNRLWLIVGYSGENDPVFEQLTDNNFDERLYWVGHQDREPPPHVRKHLLECKESAFYVKGYDADAFFVSLAQALGCFPPVWVGKPFTHLDETLDQLASFQLPGTATQTLDIGKTTRRLINQAVKDFEEGDKGITLLAENDLLAGRYDQVITSISKPKSQRQREILAWAYVMQGNELGKNIKRFQGIGVHKFANEAANKYANALQIQPSMYEALYSWGWLLAEQAEYASENKAKELFKKAETKFVEALQIKPDLYEALSSWGLLFCRQIKGANVEEAERFFNAAEEKFAEALRIKPNDYITLCNWGALCFIQAKRSTGEKADKLFNAAEEKFFEVLRFKPDDHLVLFNWGIMLLSRAKRSKETLASSFFKAAEEKFIAAEKLQRGLAAYELACLNALRGDFAECRKWLEKARDCKVLPDKDQLRAELNLDPVREEAWFKAFMQTL